MKRTLFVLAWGATLAVAVPAFAQDEDWSDDSGSATPAPPPARPAASASSSGATDHDTTVGAWGFQVTDGPSFEAALGDLELPMVGVRKWTSRTSGWEAGALFLFAQEGGDPGPSLTMVGGTFGYLQTLGIAKHMSVYWEPQGTLLVVLPNDDNPNTDDPTQLLLQGRLSVGTEIRLGSLGLPQLGVNARVAAGLIIANDGDNSDFVIGTEGGLASSVRGLLESEIGFIWYIP